AGGRRRPLPRRGDSRARAARRALRRRSRRDRAGAAARARAGRSGDHARRRQRLEPGAAAARRPRGSRRVIARQPRAALERALGARVCFDAPLARHTSLGVGGPADALAAPESADELALCVRVCADEGIPLAGLGGGFNTVGLDGGVEGLVRRTQRVRQLAASGTEVSAEAGVSHAQMTRFCVERGLAGLEFAAGIPGSAGGWIAMNAGIPEREAGEVVVDVELATPLGRERVEREALRFGYRAAAGLPARALLLRAPLPLR